MSIKHTAVSYYGLGYVEHAIAGHTITPVATGRMHHSLRTRALRPYILPLCRRRVSRAW